MREVIHIPFVFDRDVYNSWIKLERYSDSTDELNMLLEECLPLVKPKAIIREALIESVNESESVIGGFTFHSSVLAWNLSRTDRAWAYIISCGQEIYSRLTEEKDPLRQYWIDALAEQAVQFASDYIKDYMEKHVQKNGMGALSFMNPGSADRDIWDLRDQEPLFGLIGHVERDMGVILTEGFLMEPSKTLSGIYFQTKEGFVSCWVCSQPCCHTRQAAYRKDFKEKIINRA